MSNKFLPRLSERTSRLRQLLKEKTAWSGVEQERDFTTIKERLSEEPELAHYAKDKDNVVTTDTSNTGLGITLWHKQFDGEMKPLPFGSRLLNDTENKTI